MNEFLDESREELKRVEHIIYVSLKYTRTVDIIRNALNRLVSMFDFLIDALVDHAKKEKKFKEIPKSPRLKVDLVRDAFENDERILWYMNFYVFLRDILKAKYTKREEYRRHVTMVAELWNRTVEVDIDALEDCFLKVAKEFLEYTEIILGEREKE